MKGTRRALARHAVRVCALLFLLCTPRGALADDPVIVSAQLTGTTLSVTLRHPDTGWDHYADGWEVLTPNGTSLGLRRLAHPHVSEQTFTRALGGVVVPEGVTQLHIRARCLRDGWASDVYVLDLP